MRLGWDATSKNAPELAARAERAGVKAITVHGRTRQQFDKDAADWRAVAEVKRATRLPVIVNGDIIDAETARGALAASGADAVMIGRGAYGRPWIAASIERALSSGGPMMELAFDERLSIVMDHFHDNLKFYGDALGVRIFRKHLGWYLEGLPWPVATGAKRATRSQACRLTDPREVETFLIDFWNPSSRPTFH